MFIKDAADEDGVLNATPKMLKPVEGIGPRTIKRVVGGPSVRLAFELCRREASYF